MTWSTALRQFGQAIAYTMRFQLGLVLVAWALFVAGRLAAISTGLLGVLFTIVAGGTVAAFAIRWSMAPANAEVKASARELEETVRGMTKAREAAADEHSGERPAKSDNPRQQP